MYFSFALKFWFESVHFKERYLRCICFNSMSVQFDFKFKIFQNVITLDFKLWFDIIGRKKPFTQWTQELHRTRGPIKTTIGPCPHQTWSNWTSISIKRSPDVFYFSGVSNYKGSLVPESFLSAPVIRKKATRALVFSNTARSINFKRDWMFIFEHFLPWSGRNLF